jgi:hypothetical protein
MNAPTVVTTKGIQRGSIPEVFFWLTKNGFLLLGLEEPEARRTELERDDVYVRRIAPQYMNKCCIAIGRPLLMEG